LLKFPVASNPEGLKGTVPTSNTGHKNGTGTEAMLMSSMPAKVILRLNDFQVSNIPKITFSYKQSQKYQNTARGYDKGKREMKSNILYIYK
jgi:hypothetical protein